MFATTTSANGRSAASASASETSTVASFAAAFRRVSSTAAGSTSIARTGL